MIALKEQSDPERPFQRFSLRALWSRRAENPPGLTGARCRGLEAEPDWKVDKILVATDFSACAAVAVARAAALARRHDGTLTILHVVDVNPPAAVTHCGNAEDLMRQLWATGVSELAQSKKTLEENHTRARTLIVEGFPVEAIVEASSGFDLLVIGEPASKPAWNFFSTRTARRIIERALCPVWVVCQESSTPNNELERKAKAAA